MGDDLYEHVRNNAANEFDKLLESNNKHLGYKFNGTYLEFVRAVYDAAALVLNVDTRHNPATNNPDDVDVAVYDLVRRDDIDNLRDNVNDFSGDLVNAARQLINNVKPVPDKLPDDIQHAINSAYSAHDIWAKRAALIDAWAYDVSKLDATKRTVDAAKQLLAANRVGR